MNNKCMLSVSAVAFCLCAFQAKSDINWLSTVSDGYYDDTSSWDGGIIPTNAAIGKIYGNNDYTIRFPVGGLTENSVTRVGNLSNGRSVTFDTTGTWWLKSGPDAWPNSWTGFQMQNASGSHIFNIEGLTYTSAANDYPIMLMSNALFRIDSYSSVVTNTLEQGLLNLYNPGGINKSSHSLITGNAYTRHFFIVKADSTLRANQLRMRGTPLGNTMIFEGGNHEIYNGLNIGEGATNAGTTNTVLVESGSLSLPGGTLYIGNGKTGSHGDLTISGTAAVNVHNQIFLAYPTSSSTNSGSLHLSNTASLSSDSSLIVANGKGSTATILLEGDSSLTPGSYIDVAYGASSTATITQEDNTSISSDSNLAIARGNDSVATMTMKGQSTCYIGGYLLIGGYAGSDGTLAIQDNAGLTVANYCKIGAGGGSGRLELSGGEMIANRVLGDATGWSEFYADNGTITADNISSSVNLIEAFDLAELGNAGLTVDSAGYDVVIDQNFTDADSSEGLFIKKGSGTLSAAGSSHTRTLISGGGLLLTDSDAHFGQSIVLTNGTFLSLEGTAESLTAGDLTVGTTAAMASLYLDSNDSIIVTNSNGLILNSCGVVYGGAADNGTYTLFRSTGAVINSAALDNIILLNPVPGKDYAFAVVPDGDDSTIQLTVSTVAIQQALWDGSESADWNTADNWTPASVPSNGTYTTFNSTGAEKTVNISSQAKCTGLIFDSSVPYLIQGELLSVSAGSISNVLGSHTLSMPLSILGDFSVLSTAASTTTVSGAISAYQSPLISKNGSGTLVISGDNTGFCGKWETSGGRLNFGAPAALGDASTETDAITVGAGTLTYSGSTPASVEKGITFNPGTSVNSAIVEGLGNIEINGPVNVQSGVFCKRGTEEVTFDIGSSTAVLSAGNGSGGVNNVPSGVISFPESGDSPSSAAGLGGFNVLEGTLRLRGNGTGSSVVNQLHYGILGGQVTSCLADPVLELDNIRMNQGGAGLHFNIASRIDSSCTGIAPTLRMVNNAALYPNMIRMGYGVSAECYPTLIMSNSTCVLSWQLDIGYNSSTYPVVRLMQGSYVNSTAGSQWGGGIYINRNVDVLVAENSILSQTASGGCIRFNDSAASGTMRFESGGTMCFAHFQGRNTSTADGLNVIFDNGIMKLLDSGFSYSTATDKQSFIIEAGGLTVETPAGVSHSLTFPITGSGVLTKTGPGELIFAEGVSYTSQSATNHLGVPSTTTGIATGSYTGGTQVEEGSLSISNGTIRTDAVVGISSGAVLNLSNSSITLGEVSGSGTISGGTLYADYRCHVSDSGNDNLTFEDVTLPAGLSVSFDEADGYSLTNHQVLAVATQTGSTDLNVDLWPNASINQELTATFYLQDNTVYAEVSILGGTVIIIR